MSEEQKKFNNNDLNLEILAEEAAEVIEMFTEAIKALSKIIRIKSKITRFGIDDFHIKNKIPNRESLEEEIGHFNAMVEILIENQILFENNINIAEKEKLKKLSKWYKFL